jgi:hypothetical protein
LLATKWGIQNYNKVKLYLPPYVNGGRDPLILNLGFR